MIPGSADTGPIDAIGGTGGRMGGFGSAGQVTNGARGGARAAAYRLAIGPKDEPVDGDDMDPRDADPDDARRAKPEKHERDEARRPD